MRILDVAVAILRDSQGRVLINERLGADAHAGHWEFPGGKFEMGETPAQAVRRECQEELGIEVHRTRPLITFTHRYPAKTVRLHVYEVLAYAKVPHGLEGQPLRWVALTDLAEHSLLPADHAIIKALRLPHYCFVSPRLSGNLAAGKLLEYASSLLAEEKKILFQLRQHQLSAHAYIACVQEILAAAAAFTGTDQRIFLQLNTTPQVFQRINTQVYSAIPSSILLGLHLTADRLRASETLPGILPGHGFLGASIHTRDELDLCLQHDLDYAILGTVNSSLTHAHKEPMGWEQFSLIIDDKPLPVYAIGGLGKEDIHTARQYGAQGIAAMRAFMHAK